MTRAITHNSVPWDMQKMSAPFGHGFMMSCLAGCPTLNPNLENMMAKIPGCKMKFRYDSS